MPELQRLRADHASEILAFELANRSYFASSISDRGDAYFDEFPDGYRALLAIQETGRDAYYVLVDDDGSILGRFNLVNIGAGSAELGYRVAQRAAGRGLATSAVQEMCRLAASEHDLGTLRSRTTYENVGSRRVLAKAGFVAVGVADVAGRAGTWFERSLAETGGTQVSPPRPGDD